MESLPIKIPSLLQIESSTACNATCNFCPRSKMQRQQGSMSDELFLKIADEARQLGIPSILLFLNGEPTLFRRFVPWLEELRKRGLKTTIFTNASNLTESISDQWVSYADVIENIVFSVAGKDPHTHRAIMGLDHQKVVANVRYFIASNNGRIPCEAHMPLYSETAPWVDDWRRLWSFIVGNASTTHMYNWAGDIKDTMATRPHRKFCDRLNHLTVLWNGKVALCCMDIEGRVILGDLNCQTIVEVFNGPIATRIRELHKQRRWDEVELCAQCNMNL